MSMFNVCGRKPEKPTAATHGVNMLHTERSIKDRTCDQVLTLFSSVWPMLNVRKNYSHRYISNYMHQYFSAAEILRPQGVQTCTAQHALLQQSSSHSSVRSTKQRQY